MPRTEGEYQLDFARAGGVILTEPWVLEPLGESVGVPIDEAQRRVDRESARIKEALAEMNKAGRGLDRAHTVYRKILRQTLLPQPGIVAVGDGYYTGWFRAKQGWATKVVFAQREGEERLSVFLKPYFRLDEAEADRLNAAMAIGPITMADYQIIATAPKCDTHPEYTRVLSLPVYGQAGALREKADYFWQQLPPKDSADLGEFVQSNILELAIYQYAGNESREAVLQEVVQVMRQTRTTAFPLAKDAAVVCYLNDADYLEYRVVKMPAGKMPLFQRLGNARQLPMRKQEFLDQYRSLVGSLPG